MSIPIDVIYVNKADQVVAIDAAMKPWAFGRIQCQCQYVLEVPTRAATLTGTGVGDQLCPSPAK